MKYKVEWETAVGVGMTYYSGTEIVNVSEETLDEEVRDITRHYVWSRAFDAPF